MKISLLLILLSMPFFLRPANAQMKCLNGDCSNGTGKAEYIEKGLFIGNFEGVFKDGNLKKGNFSFSDGTSYYGEWHENNFHGFGIQSFSDGNLIAGRWHKGMLSDSIENASVLSILKNNISIPQICEDGDCYQSISKAIDFNGNFYSGEFKNGLYEGFGEMLFKNGDFYRGNWKEGNFHGIGSYYDTKRQLRKGEWEDGRFVANPTEIYALIVGIGDYINFEKLNFTKGDAMAFYRHLKSPAGGMLSNDNILLLTDRDANALKIRNKMADLFAMADSNDLVIFYFAGHGIDGAFLPVDYDGFSNYLDHNSLINAMQDSEAKYKIIIADACHSGSFAIKYEEYRKNGDKFPLTSVRGGKTVNDRLKDFYGSFSKAKKGLAVISSSAADEISLEANNLKQGVFSYYLIEALKGAADSDQNTIISAKELFNYVFEKVHQFTAGYQTPNFMGHTFGESDFSDIPIGICVPDKNSDSDK
jgi:hypothetical protein